MIVIDTAALFIKFAAFWGIVGMLFGLFAGFLVWYYPYNHKNNP